MWDGVGMRGKALKFVSIAGGVVGAIVIALGAKILVNTSPVPPPSKPYDVAMYDVYSALIPNIEKSWFEPPPGEGLIRVETLSFQDSGLDAAGKPSTAGEIVSDERFKPAVDSAIADYLKRNKQSFQLQRKFNFPDYDLFTKAELQSIIKGADPCLAFQQKYPGYLRWVELSAVGFNQDQTVAVVYFVESKATTRGFCSGWSFENGGYRVLQKRDGKWSLLANQAFSDWIT
jgi:hypothetical protein